MLGTEYVTFYSGKQPCSRGSIVAFGCSELKLAFASLESLLVVCSGQFGFRDRLWRNLSLRICLHAQ